MLRLTYRRRADAAANDLARLMARGFLRAAIEADAQGTRLTVWTRSGTEERLVRSIVGEPTATGQERLDEEALADWSVKVAPGSWILGHGVAVPKGAKLVIRLPMGSGFGLGDHPSTVLAAGLLAGEAVQGLDVLDLGSGSGVLAAQAGLMGAALVHAVDLDTDAVQHTRKTLKANRVAGKVWASNLLKKVKQPYGLVCANLVGDLLCELFASGDLHRVVAPGGRVILSGISDAKRDAVKAAFAADGWRLVRRKDTGDWFSGVIAARS